jgi:hypothetical protein
MDQSSIEKWLLFKEVLQDYPQDIEPLILYFYLVVPCRECKSATLTPIICLKCYPTRPVLQSAGCEECGSSLLECVKCGEEECNLHYYLGEPVTWEEHFSDIDLGAYRTQGHQCDHCEGWICFDCVSKGWPDVAHGYDHDDGDVDMAIWLCPPCSEERFDTVKGLNDPDCYRGFDL